LVILRATTLRRDRRYGHATLARIKADDGCDRVGKPAPSGPTERMLVTRTHAAIGRVGPPAEDTSGSTEPLTYTGRQFDMIGRRSWLPLAARTNA